MKKLIAATLLSMISASAVSHDCPTDLSNLLSPENTKITLPRCNENLIHLYQSPVKPLEEWEKKYLNILKYNIAQATVRNVNLELTEVDLEVLSRDFRENLPKCEYKGKTYE